jgi:hypothetical protein
MISVQKSLSKSEADFQRQFHEDTHMLTNYRVGFYFNVLGILPYTKYSLGGFVV